MKRVLLGLLAAGLAGATSIGAQLPVFSSKVDLVLVDVLVTSRGAPVAGLTAADFEVRDNRVLQRLDSVTGGVASVAAVTLDLVLVFDASESMAGANLHLLIDASRALLDGLRPGDRVALVTFADRTELVHPLSSDLSSLARSLGSIVPNGRTSMFDGLYTGLMLRRGSTTRAAVLLFSDGLDNASWLEEPAVRKVARESDVVVYGVGLDDSVRTQLRDIVDETGGEIIDADSAKQLKPAFLRLLGQMQARYLLAYYPRDVAREGWHTLDVRLVRQKGRDLRARRGYYIPLRAPAGSTRREAQPGGIPGTPEPESAYPLWMFPFHRKEPR